MAELSLAQAAALTGKSKSTIARAIKSGRLSAARRAGGAFSVDPSNCSASILTQLAAHHLRRMAAHLMRRNG